MKLNYAQDGATGEWIFWQYDKGWGSLEDATVYRDEALCLEGDWLPLGKDVEFKPYAALMLDLEYVLSEHQDINLASQHARWMLASWLAQGLRKSLIDDMYVNSDIEDVGYALYLIEE